jgi:antitoxin MazE
MKTRIIQIGNSQGIRIPKVLLDQNGLGDEVELKVNKKKLSSHFGEENRQGWEEAFQKIAGQGDDQLA